MTSRGFAPGHEEREHDDLAERIERLRRRIAALPRGRPFVVRGHDSR
jgi:hypothetical protein